MSKIRNAPNRTNHHSGTTPFGFRAKKHAAKGHTAPFVAAYVDAYAKDPKAAAHVVINYTLLVSNLFEYVLTLLMFISY